MERTYFYTLWFDLPLFEQGTLWVHDLVGSNNIVDKNYRYITITEKEYPSMNSTPTNIDDLYLVVVIQSAYSKEMKRRIRNGLFGPHKELTKYFIFFVYDPEIPNKGIRPHSERYVIRVNINDRYTQQVNNYGKVASSFMNKIGSYSSLFLEGNNLKAHNFITKVKLGRYAEVIEVIKGIKQNGTKCGDNGGIVADGIPCGSYSNPNFRDKITSPYYGRCMNHPRKGHEQKLINPQKLIKLVEISIGKHIQTIRYYIDGNYFTYFGDYNISYHYGNYDRVIYEPFDLVNGVPIVYP